MSNQIPRDRPDAAEIVVTDAMLEAELDKYAVHDPALAEVAVVSIFPAMVLASPIFNC